MKACPRCVGGRMLRDYDFQDPREVCVNCGHYDQNIIPLDDGKPDKEVKLVYRRDLKKWHKQREGGQGGVRSGGVRL